MSTKLIFCWERESTMDIFSELFRDDKYVYVQIMSYPETINEKIPLNEFELWREIRIEQ